MDDKKDNKNPFQNNEESEETLNTQETEHKEENKEENKIQQEADVDSTEDSNEDPNKDSNKESKDSYKEKYEELNNKYLRLAADFDNFRKRTIQEKQDLSEFTTCEVLKKVVQILDTFERANEHLKNIEEPKTLKEGYDVVYKQFIDTLKKLGLEEIEAIGKEFDPQEHEAITQVESDEIEAGHVALVAQKGYKYNKRIVRPAFVGVAKKKEDE